MIEVLHVITGLGAGGAERQLAMLCQNSDPARIRHQVVSLTGPGIWGARLARAGIPVRCLDLPRGKVSLLAPLRLAAIVRAARPAILQSWLYHADLLGTLAAPLAGRPKLIWSIRCSDMRLELYSPLTRLVVRLLARLSRRPTAVAVNSIAGRRVHEALGYRPRLWRLVPNGIDTDLFRPDETARGSVRAELGLEPDALLVGHFSRHDPMKDHPTGLAAFAEVASRAWLLLAGETTGPDNQALTREIAAAGLDAARVKRLGLRQDMPRLTAALDVALSSSAFGEGFPNILAEAMASGVPCVATRSGDAEMLLGGLAPLAVPGDAAALAAGLESLIALAPAERQALGARLRQRAEEFSIARMVAAYSDLYDEVLGSRA
jgi:glycosyltransferase involved in cell wall biosynthesis